MPELFLSVFERFSLKIMLHPQNEIAEVFTPKPHDQASGNKTSRSVGTFDFKQNGPKKGKRTQCATHTNTPPSTTTGPTAQFMTLIVSNNYNLDESRSTRARATGAQNEHKFFCSGSRLFWTQNVHP